MLQPNKKIPSPNDILGTKNIPSPSDILGDSEKKKYTGTVIPQELDSETPTGSLDIQEPSPFDNKNIVGQIPSGNDIKLGADLREKQLRDELSKVKVTPKNMDSVNAKTTELSTLLNAKSDREIAVRNQKVKELTNASMPYTQISPDKEEKINTDYDNAVNKTGIWNKTKQFGTDVLNTSMNVLNKLGMVDEVGDLKLEDPLKKAREETLKDVKTEGLSLTAKQFNEKVKDNFLQNRKNEIIHSQLNDFNSSLTPEDRGLLNVDRYNHLTNLDTSQKQLLDNTQLLKHNRLEDVDNYYSLISDINKRITSGQEVPEQLNAQRSALESRIKNYDSQINYNYNKFNSNKKDIGTFKQELEVYNTEGNDFINFVGHVKNAGLRIGAESLDFGAYLSNVYGDATGNLDAKVTSDYLHEKADKLNKSIEEDSSSLKQTKTIESPTDFLNTTTNVVADNAPIIALLTASGGAGLGIMGATMTGQKYGEMRNEVNEGKADYGDLKMALVPLAWGGTSLIPLATQLKTIQNTQRALLAIERESPELIQKTLKEKATEYIKEFGKESFKLGNELKVMGIVQEGINHFALGKDVNYDSLLDLGVYAEAPVMHLMAKASPHLLGMSVKPFMSDNDVKTMDNNSAKIFELNKQLQNPDLGKEERSIIENAIKSTADNSRSILNEKIKSISNTPEIVQKAIIDKSLISSDIRTEALRVKTADNLSDSAKEIALNELKERYKKNELEKNNLISGNANVLDVLPQKESTRLKNDAGRELMEELNPDGKKSITISDSDISKRAVEIYNKEEKLKQEKIDAEEQAKVIEQAEPQPQAEVQETGKEATELNTSEKFKKSVDLYNRINETEGGSKKRELVKERKAFLDENPTIKFVDDNIRDITRQLEEKGELKKLGDCP